MPAITKIEKYEIAGRLELGREGDCITYKDLANQYDKSVRSIATIRAETKDNFSDFRPLAIEAAEKYYDRNGIEVSAGSVRAYLQSRQLSDYETVKSSVEAHEEKVRGILDNFQTAPIQLKKAKDVIECTIRKLALNPIDAHTVNAALEDIGNALDQLEPSSSMDQRGVAPREFYKQISPCLNIVNSRLLIQYTFICGEIGRKPRSRS